MRFKNTKGNLKIKILQLVFFSFILTFSMVSYIIKKSSKTLISAAINQFEYENDMIFKKAYKEKYSADINVDELIKILRNNKDEIIQVDFNIDNCEKILMTIIEAMNYDTAKFVGDGFRYSIPIGYITSSPMLINLGPKIPIKISTTDVVLGEVRTKITDFGINNALVEIYVDLKIKISAVLPSATQKKELKYSALIASKIITGVVPNFYNGKIIRESELFNLPIEQNM